jgi:hypothetical protein
MYAMKSNKLTHNLENRRRYNSWKAKSISKNAPESPWRPLYALLKQGYVITPIFSLWAAHSNSSYADVNIICIPGARDGRTELFLAEEV